MSDKIVVVPDIIAADRVRRMLPGLDVRVSHLAAPGEAFVVDVSNLPAWLLDDQSPARADAIDTEERPTT